MSVKGNGLTINHGARGESTVITQRTDQTRLVSFGSNRGYVEHPLVRNGAPYIQRTYVTSYGSYARVYRGAYYHGFLFYRYVPPFFFAPGFYGWAFAPWGAGIGFNWGWGPWFGRYSYYFTPYPYYLDASMWLTDYAIAQQFQESYNAGYYAGQQGYAPPDQSSYAPLTPELKQAIDDEVKAQLAEESSAAANPSAMLSSEATPDALNPQIRTFIVSTGLTEQLPNAAMCPLAPGDVLTRIDDMPDANQNVRVMVSSSQANDCPAGSQLMVGVRDLQDMHNAFREHVDAGLRRLAQTQGKNGIPSGPAPNPTPYAEGTAQPDPSAQQQLQQQQNAAQQAEQDVTDAAGVD